jgi:UDP-3-O-[3-hydroxymyristoyl] glucosamine N-acyltransferase
MPANRDSYSLGELAVCFGCELAGDPEARVNSVASLDGGVDAVGFFVNPIYLEQLSRTQLGAVILERRFVARCPVAALIHSNPHAIFARMALMLHPAVPVKSGVHSSAVVHATARLAPDVEVAALAVIEAGASIGAGSVVGPQCFVGRDAVIGANTRLVQGVSIGAGVVLGQRCLVHPGAVIGADGFGNAREGARWVKVPQLGGVVIGDDVHIGANTTIDRGALGDTRIDEGARLDNQIQVGHNVHIGAHTAIAACTGIAGSTRIGTRCMIGGGAGIGGQIQIGDDIVIMGFGMVTRSITVPGAYSSVLPVEEVRLWRRIVGRIKRLDVLAKRVKKLENAAGIAANEQENDN